MENFVCMFSDSDLAREVERKARKVGLEAKAKPILWNRPGGDTVVTHAIVSEATERTKLLDFVAEEKRWHGFLLKCPTCQKPSLEPLRRYGRSRFYGLSRTYHTRRITRSKGPVFCRYCRREMKVDEAFTDVPQDPETLN